MVTQRHEEGREHLNGHEFASHDERVSGFAFEATIERVVLSAALAAAQMAPSLA